MPGIRENDVSVDVFGWSLVCYEHLGTDVFQLGSSQYFSLILLEELAGHLACRRR